MLNTVGGIIIIIFIIIIIVFVVVVVQEKVCFALRLVRHIWLQSKSELLTCFSL